MIPLVLFVLGKGRAYYLAAAYPMLMAMGAVAGERWVATVKRAPRWTMEAVFFTGLAAVGLYAGAVILPLAPDGWLRNFALERNGDLREEIGWDDIVKTVAGIRDSLPPEQRENAGVLVGNYGEAGAIEILGPAYGLPAPISMTNSAWLRGYPKPPPSTLIVLGFSRNGADRAFTSCRVAGHNNNGVKNEESQDHPDIFVCDGPRLSWAEFWKRYQNFG